MGVGFAIGAGIAGLVTGLMSIGEFIITALVAFVGPLVMQVGATIGGIVGVIADVVGPLLTTVGDIVGGIVTTLKDVMGAVIEAVGGVFEAISAGLKASINFLKAELKRIEELYLAPFKGTMKKLAEAAYGVIKPIVDPIYDSLKTIRDFVVDTRTWIVTELKPVADLVGFIQDISAVAVVTDLLAGTTIMADILGDVGETADAATIQGIAVLYREIVQTSVGTLEIMRNHYTRLRDSIDDTDERLRADMQLAIEYTKETIQGEIDKVRDALSERLTPMELQIAGIERRTMDLPFFQQMLIRALD